MRIFISLFLFVTLQAINAMATTGFPVSRHWENAFWGGGGSYPVIMTDPELSSRVYLISDVAGAWYSDNKGGQWNWMNTGTSTIIDYSMAQSEYNPDIMYILGSSKLNKSTNRGKSWSEVASFSGIRGQKTIVIDRVNPNIVYVGLSNGQIKKTTDGGTTWTTFGTPFGSGIQVYFLWINKTSTYMIAGSSSHGMIRYDLVNGTSSSIALTGTNALRNWDFGTYTVSGTEHLCVTAGWHISCTTDNGVNWTDTADITADSTFFISAMCNHYLANTHVRFLAHGRRTSTPYGTNIDVVSSDDGSTWTSFYTNVTVDASSPEGWINFGATGNVYNFASDPLNEDVYYLTTDLKVFRSDDGGSNWTERTRGAQNTVVTDVTVSPNGTIFACGMDIGLYYSTDNGDTWTAAIPHTSTSDPQGFPIAGHYWRVLTTGTLSQWNAGTGHVLVTASRYIDPYVFEPAVYRSTNNGVTWTETSTGLPTTQLSGTGTSNQAAWGIGYPRGFAKSSDGNTIYVSVDGFSSTENGGIFKSTNNGQTWTRTTQPSAWKVYNGLAVDPTDATGHTAVFGEFFGSNGHNPQFFKTTDGGTTWTDTDTISYGNYDVTYNSVGNVYATGLYLGPEAYYSTNGGSGTWNFMKQLNSTANIADGILVDPMDNNRFFVGVNDGTSSGPGTGSHVGGSVYMTTSALNFANATWTNITGDLPSPSGVQALAINKFAGNKGYLLAAIDGAGVFRLNLDDTSPTILEKLDVGK